MNPEDVDRWNEQEVEAELGDGTKRRGTLMKFKVGDFYTIFSEPAPGQHERPPKLKARDLLSIKLAERDQV
jgi:hypothetical protein